MEPGRHLVSSSVSLIIQEGVRCSARLLVLRMWFHCWFQWNIISQRRHTRLWFFIASCVDKFLEELYAHQLPMNAVFTLSFPLGTLLVAFSHLAYIMPPGFIHHCAQNLPPVLTKITQMWLPQGLCFCNQHNPLMWCPQARCAVTVTDGDTFA